MAVDPAWQAMAVSCGKMRVVQLVQQKKGSLQINHQKILLDGERTVPPTGIAMSGSGRDEAINTNRQ